MDEQDIIRRLQELTGVEDIWDYSEEPENDRSNTGIEGGWNKKGGTDAADESYQNAVCGGVPGDGEWDPNDIVMGIQHLTTEEKAEMNHQDAQNSYPKARNDWKDSKAIEAAAAVQRGHSLEPVIHSHQLEKLEADMKAWPECGLRYGDEAPVGQQFCPWKVVRCYPETYIGKRNGARAAPFFEPECISSQVWDFYYLQVPRDISKEPLLFVPTEQFDHYLQFINAKLDINLTIPPGAENSSKFELQFDQDGMPRPRFLLRSTNHEAFMSLRKNSPGFQREDMQKLSEAGLLAAENFRERLISALSAGKKSGRKKKSDKNRQKRIESHRTWGCGLKRVQRYLGIRQKSGQEGRLVALRPDGSISTKEPEMSVVFVAIDVEAYELNQNLITEVGVSVLDTNDIVGVDPGSQGLAWCDKVKSHHVRIKENAWAMNSRHIQGCAHAFDFGESQVLMKEEVAGFVEKIIHGDSSSKSRAVVLVFHDSSQDIKYLKMLGFHVLEHGNILEIVDTKEIHQYVTRAANPAKLAFVLEYLRFGFQNLHNAGNDAAYTLRAMVGLAYKARIASLKRNRQGNQAGKKSGAADSSNHVPYAEFIARKGSEDEGWSSGGEGSDGGEPAGAHDPNPKRKALAARKPHPVIW